MSTSRFGHLKSKVCGDTWRSTAYWFFLIWKNKQLSYTFFNQNKYLQWLNRNLNVGNGYGFVKWVMQTYAKFDGGNDWAGQRSANEAPSILTNEWECAWVENRGPVLPKGSVLSTNLLNPWISTNYTIRLTMYVNM